MKGSPDLTAPRVAWPTLLLMLAAVAAWLAAFALPPVPAALLATAAAFVAFTPMHDAAHRSVARSRLVNEIVGRIGGVLLAAPFPAFRYVHLEHHKHTNEPGDDPDEWSGRGPALLRPLRWATQDLHYYAFIARRWRSRPLAERVETALGLAVIVAVALAAPDGVRVLANWLLPARAALVLLAFSFDWLPHRPHVVRARDDVYRSTHVLAEPLLTPVFQYQNYHLVHHLYPGVPFYRYAGIWDGIRADAIARGAREWRLFSPRPAA